MSVNLLVIVISCLKNRNRFDSILGKNVSNMLIAVGGAEKSSLNGNILSLECNDKYEGLPEKMICAIDFILKCDNFKDITHILKIDDDNSFTSEDIANIPKGFATVLTSFDYIGQRIWPGINRRHNRDWHFNKVSPDSHWHNRLYEGNFTDWADGGCSYILSRNALEIINNCYDTRDLEHISRTEIYEDVMISKVLARAGISPKLCNYGIKGDK
jgi:hypothetical protein